MRDEALEYLRFWLQSVSTHAVATSEQLSEADVACEDGALLAPMLLVGTHLDGINRETRTESLKTVQTLLVNTFKDIAAFKATTLEGGLLHNDKGQRIPSPETTLEDNESLCFFPVNNRDPNDPNVAFLRGRIVECAREDKLGYGV